MKNKELFDKSVDILVKAYQNDTLEHKNCYACAVGNLVAASNNEKIVRNDRINYNHAGYDSRGFLIPNIDYTDTFTYNLLNHKLSCGKQKNQTGYSDNDLRNIEKAFETADRGSTFNDQGNWVINREEWMFNGLLAVYDVLCEIHEVNKEEVKKPELVFVK